MSLPTLRRVLDWRDPPPAARGELRGGGPRRSWAPVLADLQDRAGEWGVVCEQEDRTTCYTASSILRKWGCDVTMRGPVAGPFDLYARWPEQRAPEAA